MWNEAGGIKSVVNKIVLMRIMILYITIYKGYNTEYSTSIQV